MACVLRCHYDHKLQKITKEVFGREAIERILLIELERTYREDFQLDTQTLLKPNLQSNMQPNRHWRLVKKQHLIKQYPSYKHFKYDYTHKKGRVGHSFFVRSNHSTFWKYVIGLTDEGIEAGLEAEVSNVPLQVTQSCRCALSVRKSNVGTNTGRSCSRGIGRPQKQKRS